MGLCASQDDKDIPTEQSLQKSKDLDRDLEAAEVEDKKVLKLLLLGTGESGKSTVFKQMQLLYAEGFSDFEKANYRSVVRRNVVEALHCLIKGAMKFGYPLSPKGQESANYILSLDPLSNNFWHPSVVDHVMVLWNNDGMKEEAIQKTFERRNLLQIPDAAQFFFDKIAKIGEVEYIPTAEDILRARLRTTGIVQKDFHIHGAHFKFLDVGGQRNERRKWIHCFDNVTAVIFVTAISEYDQLVYEEEKENRVQEAIRVFDDVCNAKHFKDTAMIMFLNKFDLFKVKIKTIPITVCFPEYNGDNSAEDAGEFIRLQFMAVNRAGKRIYAHFTTVTDTTNVEKVFRDVKDVVVQRNLEEVGLD